MATGKRDLRWFLDRLPAESKTNLPPLRPGDLSRLSVQRMQQALGGAQPRSAGSLRIHGDGVQDDSVRLEAVGHIATAWQRIISAVGASREGNKSVRGPVPSTVKEQTALTLTTSPQPGSIILQLAPPLRTSGEGPMEETNQLMSTEALVGEHSLAGDAARDLLDFLSHDGDDDETIYWLTERLKDFGPRVGSALNSLTEVVSEFDVTLDAEWDRFEETRAWATLAPSRALWLRNLVSGHGLDTEEVVLLGSLHTVSMDPGWRVEIEDGRIIRFNASKLGKDAATRWSVGSRVAMRMVVEGIEQPDGRIRQKFTAFEIAHSKRDLPGGAEGLPEFVLDTSDLVSDE